MQRIPLAVSRKVKNNILFLVVLSFAFGIVFENSISWPGITFWLILSPLLAIAVLLARRFLSLTTSYLLLLFLFLALGIIDVNPYLKPPNSPSHIYNQITHRQSVTVLGVLTKTPSIIRSSSGLKTRLLMATHEIWHPNGKEQKGTVLPGPSTGLIQLTVKGPPPSHLRPGDYFMAKALLSRVHSYSIPDAFNYKDFLAHQSIWITGWIESRLNIVKINEPAPLRLEKSLIRYRYLPEQIRYRIATFLDQTLNDQTEGLYKAILLGDKSEISQNTLENFRGSGCLHILAISGMHMGLLYIMIITFLNWLLRRSTWVILHLPVLKIASFLSLIPLIMYAFIAGLNTPVIRALLMAAVIILATVFDRQKSMLTTVSLAAFLILLWNPVSIFTVSFQLSFAAVTALATIYPIIFKLLLTKKEPDIAWATLNTTSDQANGASHSRLDKLSALLSQKKQNLRNFHKLTTQVANWVIAAVLISVTAWLGTAPLLLYYFNRISLLSPLTNLLVEPFICFWALPIGLIASCIIPVLPGLSSFLFWAGGLGLNAAGWLASFFASLPFSEIWTSTPTAIEIMGYYLLLAGLLFPVPHVTAKNNVKVKAILVIACLFLLISIPSFAKIKRKMTTWTTATFMDVGQGTSTLLELPRGQVVLLDGGGVSSERFNVGEKLIAPYLWKQRISCLDGMIITHPHADHYNGLFFLIRRFRPKKLWINGHLGDDANYTRLLNLAKHLDVEIDICRPGSILFQSGPAIIRCIANPCSDILFSPSSNSAARDITTMNLNNSSLVLKLQHLGKNTADSISFLFPGDIDRETERELLNHKTLLDADVLLSAHHGSRSSNSHDFLEAVSPEHMIVSMGPYIAATALSPSLIEFCHNHNAKMYTTARDGTISITTNGEKIYVQSSRDRSNSNRPSFQNAGASAKKLKSLEKQAQLTRDNVS